MAQRHCGTVPDAMVCAILSQPLFISFIGNFFFSLDFPIHSCFIAGFIPLLFLFVLVYIPSLPFCYAGFARISSHIGTNPHVLHTPRVYFAANILFSFFSFRFSCLCCEDIIMFSLYLSPESRLPPQPQNCDLIQ